MNEATDRLGFAPLPYYVAHLDCGHERVSVVPIASENVHADRLFSRQCRCHRDVTRREASEGGS